MQTIVAQGSKALDFQPGGGGFKSWSSHNFAFLGMALHPQFLGRGTMVQAVNMI